MGYSAHYWPQDRLCITDSYSQSEPDHSASLRSSLLSAHSAQTFMGILWITVSKALLKSISANPTVLHAYLIRLVKYDFPLLNLFSCILIVDFLAFYMLGSGLQDYLFHHLLKDQGEANRPVVPPSYHS